LVQYVDVNKVDKDSKDFLSVCDGHQLMVSKDICSSLSYKKSRVICTLKEPPTVITTNLVIKKTIFDVCVAVRTVLLLTWNFQNLRTTYRTPEPLPEPQNHFQNLRAISRTSEPLEPHQNLWNPWNHTGIFRILWITLLLLLVTALRFHLFHQTLTMLP
jgi:hypothetical protein